MKHDRTSRAPARSPAGGEPLELLLAEVRRRFYAPAHPAADADLDRRFHRDRRMLIHALGWPAAWLRERALTCPPARYRTLVIARLDAIAAHGDSVRFDPAGTAFFPAYLLKCLQDWFRHHGEELYDELKHIRNAIDQVLASARLAARVQRDAEALDVIAAAHTLTRPRRVRREKSDPAQMTLF